MYTTKRDNNRVLIEHYENTFDFLNTLDAREYTYHAENKRACDRNFQGVSDYNAARDLFVNGYSRPVKTLDSVNVTDSAAEKPRFYNDIVGASVCVPLALAGIPTCMINRAPRAAKSKVVRLVIDVGRAGYVSTYEITEWGKKIVSLVRALESRDLHVQITALATVSNDYNSGKVYAFRFPVKDSDRPLDVKRICFPLIHPAFQRVFKFDWYDRLPDSESNWGYGASLAYQTEDARQKTLSYILENGETYINIDTDFDALAF